jgi:hypothetical protein
MVAHSEYYRDGAQSLLFYTLLLLGCSRPPTDLVSPDKHTGCSPPINLRSISLVQNGIEPPSGIYTRSLRLNMANQ